MLRVVGRVDQGGLNLGKVGDGGIGRVPCELDPLIEVPSVPRSWVYRMRDGKSEARGSGQQINYGASCCHNP